MSLATKAMLVELSVSQCTFRKLDKHVTRTATTEFHAKHDAGRFNKCLIAKENYQEIYQTVNQARTFHYANTLPWADSGPRVLPTTNYWDYTKVIGEYKDAFWQAVQRFFENYPSFVDQAKIDLGDMFDARDYPGMASLENKFNFRTSFSPLPDAGHFYVDLSNTELENIRADITQQTNELLQNSIQSLWDKLYECVDKMAERLSATRVVKGEKKPAIFRDTLVDNLVEQCQLLTKLNLTDDPNLEQMRLEVENKLCQTDASDLRNDDDARKQTARDAQDILKQMEAYCGNATA